MLWKYKKCYSEITNTPCNFKYLSSVTATPNLTGGCNEIYVSFLPKVYTDPVEDLQIYIWDFSNTGQMVNINLCIDMSTLQYNCPGRVTFFWDENIDCCQNNKINIEK
jgi:hypothetical protein